MRQTKITRTFMKKKIWYVAYDAETKSTESGTAEIFTKATEIPKLMQAVSKIVNKPILEILDVQVENKTLYVTEEEFLSMAKELPKKANTPDVDDSEVE